MADHMRAGRAESTRRPAGVRRIVAMEVAGGLGDGIFWVGLVAALLEQGAGATALAVAAVVRLGPRALISAPAGALADRWDRRRLLVGLDLARSLLMVALAGLAATGATTAVLLVVVLASYTLAAPYRPALSAALPVIAGEARLASANALVGTTRQLMTFLGPVAGAAVLHVASPAVAFLCNGLSFLVAGVLVAGVGELRGAAAASTSPRTAPADGRDQPGEWREIWAIPGVRVVVGLVCAMYAVRGAELVLLVLLAEQLGLGNSGIGVVTGILGLGALAALPISPRVAGSPTPDRPIVAAMVATAVPFVLIAAVSGFTVTAAGLFVVGIGVVVFEVVTVVLLQRLAPLQVLGRVFGLAGTASNAGKLIGALTIPVAVAAWGVDASLAVVGISVLVVAAASTPALRSLTRRTRALRDRLQPIVEVLGSLPLLDGAPRSTLERLAAAVQPVRVEAGSSVLRQGDPADDLYVVRAGRFEVLDGDRRINTMGPGEWFGEIGLLQGSPRTASVRATTQAELWRIPGDAFLAGLGNDAAGSSALFEVMADRLDRSARSRGVPPGEPGRPARTP
ncbi:MAG: MFS transporter [Acidimicrobiales bacterium]|nr:MFS transporter [Acidimicrobiales bacterium]